MLKFVNNSFFTAIKICVKMITNLKKLRNRRFIMDKIDKQILEILQENARTPRKSIAEQVFLSSPAF